MRTPALPPSGPLYLRGRGRTWVYDSGPGPASTLLLLHGWTSTAALNWYRCLPALTERYRVVAMDHRGHGRGIQSRAVFRLEACADDAAAVVETLGLGRVTAVGYSMGGPVAQLMWRRHPETVEGLVLCATAARFPTRTELSGAAGTVGLGASLALSMLPAGLRRSGMGMLTRGWAGDSVWAAEEWRRSDPSKLIQAGLALARFDSTGWIGEVDVPTAVVVTERDVTVPPRRQRALAELIPGALTLTVAGDHRVVADDPGAFVPALLSACAAVRRRARALVVPNGAGPVQRP